MIPTTLVLTTLLVEGNMFKYRLKEEIKKEMNEEQGFDDSNNLGTDNLVD